MNDLEKAIKGLECCITMPDIYPHCEECPYADEDGMCVDMDELHKDALALLKAQNDQIIMLERGLMELKAQEPVSVQKKQMEMVGLQTWDWVCGNCGQTVLFSAKFCPWCGRAVKWE